MSALGSAVWDGTNWTRNVTDLWVTANNGSPGDVYINLPLREGDVINAIRLSVQHATATLASIRMRLVQTATGVASAGAYTDSAASTAVQTLTMSPALTVPADTMLTLHINSSAGAMVRKLFGVAIDYT
jgi:hypothetical protein